MMRYSEKFREKMVGKLLGPGAQSATSLAQESGVSQATLSRWLREARMAPMAKKKDEKGENLPRSRRKRWTAAEKIRVVKEASEAGDAGLGELLDDNAKPLVLSHDRQAQTVVFHPTVEALPAPPARR